MNQIIVRNKCVICESESLKDFITIKSMPVYMGVVDKEQEFIFEDMIFTQCDNCSEIQLRKLMDVNIVYSHNHNTEIVGELWRNHYREFIEFLGEDIRGKIVLEIGDPAAKIAKLTNIFEKWIIVEKNPNLESSDKILFRKEFFDENFEIDEKVEVLIHSHLLEHIYDPLNFFRKCREILSEEGSMFFSIPDMNFSLKNGFSPNSILQFEHTYYLDNYFLKKICDITGFEINKSRYFSNHSVFYHLKKSEPKESTYNKNYELSKIFNDLYEVHVDKIKKINDLISGRDNIYLYGAHITSQFYIFSGLDFTSIKGILDGSTSKIGKYLYGTNLKTFSPSEISKIEDVTVIVSHMGIYLEEISENLKELNKNVLIL